jgi:tripartite-type tricarboxylate transporter receptor subunit TctC
VNDPEVVANFTKGGGEPRNLSGDAFAARVKREIDELRELNRSLKLTLE